MTVTTLYIDFQKASHWSVWELPEADLSDKYSLRLTICMPTWYYIVSHCSGWEQENILRYDWRLLIKNFSRKMTQNFSCEVHRGCGCPQSPCNSFWLRSPLSHPWCLFGGRISLSWDHQVLDGEEWDMCVHQIYFWDRHQVGSELVHMIEPLGCFSSLLALFLTEVAMALLSSYKIHWLKGYTLYY